MSKPKVLFFSRSFFTRFFSEINSEFFEDYHVTLTLEEKTFLQAKGKVVLGCFEDEFNRIVPEEIPGDYLKSSFSSDRFLIRFNHEKRIEILGKEIAFWRSILEAHKPDYIVNETVAIEISEVLAIEAKRLNIKILNSLCSVFSDSFYWKPDPFLGSIEDISRVRASKEDLEKAEKYYLKVVESNYKPAYVLGLPPAKRYSLKRMGGTVYRDFLLYFKKTKLKRSKRFKYEDGYSSSPFKNTKRFFNRFFYSYDCLSSYNKKRIVFFPMHFEPEATLFHFAEEYQNQEHTIDMIARALKANQYLAIKEHPQQKGALLDKRFRDLKKRHSNLIFVPAETPSQNVINICEAVVTLTSTAAWEALIYGKPVFVLGTIFFDQCPGAKKINNYYHLKEQIRREYYELPEKEKVIDFIARMMSVLHFGYPSPYFKGDFIINVNNFRLAIEKALR